MVAGTRVVAHGSRTWHLTTNPGTWRPASDSTADAVGRVRPVDDEEGGRRLLLRHVQVLFRHGARELPKEGHPHPRPLSAVCQVLQRAAGPAQGGGGNSGRMLVCVCLISRPLSPIGTPLHPLPGNEHGETDWPLAMCENTPGERPLRITTPEGGERPHSAMDKRQVGQLVRRRKNCWTCLC